MWNIVRGTDFADTGVADEKQLEEVVVFAGMHRGYTEER